MSAPTWAPAYGDRDHTLTHIERTFSDRELARMIWFALRQDTDVVSFMRRHGITLSDLWALIRRGRR